MTRRQLDDLWEVKETLSSTKFSMRRYASLTPLVTPVGVVYALLGRASPTAAWRMFRGMTRVTLSQAARVSQAGLSSIERGLNSGNQVRDKLSHALAVPADALIAHFSR